MTNNDALLKTLEAIKNDLVAIKKDMATKAQLEATENNLSKRVETVELKAEAHFAVVNRKVDQGNEQILDTIIHTADGAIEEVKKQHEKEMKLLEQKLDTIVTDHEDRIATVEHELFS